MKESWINWDPGRQGWGAEESMCGVPWVEFHLRSQTSQHDPLQSTQGLSSYSLSLFTSGDEHKKCGKSTSHRIKCSPIWLVLVSCVGAAVVGWSFSRWLDSWKLLYFWKWSLQVSPKKTQEITPQENLLLLVAKVSELKSCISNVECDCV